MCELGTGTRIEISDSSPGGLGDTLGHSGVVAVAFGFWRQGDVSETIRVFFEQSKSFPPAAKSLLTIQEVDEFLLQLSRLTKEDEQQQALQDIASRWGAARWGWAWGDGVAREGRFGGPELFRDQAECASSPRCTANDLKCIIRLIKHDLKMNSGAKHV